MAEEKPSGLSYKARRRWSLVILLIGMPSYIVGVVTIMNWIGPMSPWLQLAVYVALGIVWVLPFRFVFRGIGQADPSRSDQGKGR